MKRDIALLILVALVVLNGCDTQSNTSSTEFPARIHGLVQQRAEVAVFAAELRAEGEKLMREAAPILAAKRTVRHMSHIQSVITVPGDYPSIQDAIDAAAPGDIIQVNGTYTGQGNLAIFTDGITLDGGGEAFVQGVRFQIFSDDVHITGFTLNMRIWVIGGNRAEITHNDISNTGSGIAVFGGAEDAIIRHNNSSNNIDGLFLTDTQGNHVEHNTFDNNERFGITVTDQGFGSMPANHNTIVKNNVNGNNFGVTLVNATGNVISDCNVNGSKQHGFQVIQSMGNMVSDCNVNGNTYYGIILSDSDENDFNAVKANGNGQVGLALFDSDNNSVANSIAKGNKLCDMIDAGTGNAFTKNKFGSVNC